MWELGAISSEGWGLEVIQNLPNAALEVALFPTPESCVRRYRESAQSGLTLVLSSELRMRFRFLDPPAVFALPLPLPLPFIVLALPAVALDVFDFAVTSEDRVPAADTRLWRLRRTGSVSCGLSDRLWEFDGAGSHRESQRVMGWIRELDASALVTSLASNTGVVVGTGPGSSSWLLASPR